MTPDDRELADRAKQACSIIAHFPTDKDTPKEIHWLIKQAAWGLGKSTEQSFDLEKEFRARITAELAAKAVPKSTEIALWISERLKALPNEPCLASMQIAQYVTTELFPILTAQAEALRKENEGLREALEPFAKAADIKLCGEFEDRERFGRTDVSHHLTFGDLRKARAALENTDAKEVE